MRTIVSRDGRVSAVDVAEPADPTGSQILVQMVGCAICGSDLHVTDHTDAYLKLTADGGAPSMMWDPSVGVMLGHCYSFKVLAAGPDAVGLAPGDLGAGFGTIIKPDGSHHVLGFSDTCPGGYSERMLLSTPGLIARLPAGLDPIHGVFVEPLIVGEMAVRRAAIPDGAPAVVLGAGQVGLGIVAALKRHGRGPIVVAEPSPLRRKAAASAGADVTVDVHEVSWKEGLATTGATATPTIFNTTGLTGMLDRLFTEVPEKTHIVEVSGQFEADTMRTAIAVKKSLRLTFSSAADPDVLGVVLNALANGEVPVESWITDRVAIDDVPESFERLRSPSETIAIVVQPLTTSAGRSEK